MSRKFEQTPDLRKTAKFVGSGIQSHCDQNNNNRMNEGVKCLLEKEDLHVKGNMDQERIN